MNFIKKNIGNILFILVIGLFVINPNAKAWLIRGIMKIGFLQPGVEKSVPLQMSPDMHLKSFEGQSVKLSALKGKLVFLNFWATWCPPCLAEMPAINELYNEFTSDPNVVFLMIDADNDPAKSKRFFEKNGYRSPLYFLTAVPPAELYAGTLPTTVVISKSGEIVFREKGAADYASRSFKDFIEELANQ